MAPRKALADAWTSFENMFKGDVNRIANGYGSMHLLRMNEDQDTVLPVKIEVERDGGFPPLASCVYSGVLVRYFQDGDAMLCASSDQLSSRVRRLRRDNANRVVSPESLKQQIIQAVEEDPSLLMKRATAEHRHSHGAERFALEALGQRELENIVTDGSYRVTPEFCLADAAYAPNIESFTRECLPIQLKTANVSKTQKKRYQFSSTGGYTGMLLLCRPMKTGLAATLALPGHMAPTCIGYNHQIGSKWWPFMVKDSDLNKLLSDVFIALKTGEQNVAWPSGITVDVSSIKLRPFNDLRVPEHKNQKKEHHAREGFLSKFPDISVTYPAIQASQVDCVLQDVQVQEKCACCRYRKDRFNVILTRYFKSSEGIGSRRPYRFEDFEALLVHCPDGHRFFLIPAVVLAQRGVMKTHLHDGKTTLLCHADSPTPGEKSEDAWTRQYLYDADVEGCEERLKKALAKIANEKGVVPEIDTASAEKEAPLAALRRAYKSIPFEEPVRRESFTTRIGDARILIRRGYSIKTGGNVDEFPRYRVQLGVYCNQSRRWAQSTDEDFDVLIVYTASHLFVMDAQTLADHDLLVTEGGLSRKTAFFAYVLWRASEYRLQCRQLDSGT